MDIPSDIPSDIQQWAPSLSSMLEADMVHALETASRRILIARAPAAGAVVAKVAVPRRAL